MKHLNLLLAAAAALVTKGHTAAVVTDREAIDGVAAVLNARDPLQDIVTWDENSIFVRGERVMLFSGEIHPFRLPVPSLYLDLFQKVKAAGLNTVSFYLDWALHEGKRGDVRADGVFALEPFFNAAKEAGIYLIARPGPYIQAEVSGGGLPGWVQRMQAHPRTSEREYLDATDKYMAKIGKLIADAQITNGGPVILFQPENEYMFSQGLPTFPDRPYIEYIINQTRAAGIVVPLLSNDGNDNQRNITVPGYKDVDILGYDTYPLGFNCRNPSSWSAGRLPWGFSDWHKRDNADAPLAVGEYQGGAYDPWGGPGFENCAALLNHEFERVFYKSNWAAKTSIFNIYMLFGGTNWGNLGYDTGYTSYDYGSALAEDRTIAREKYSELKLQANFLAASPDYLVSKPGPAAVSVYADSDKLTVNPLNGKDGSGSFFVVRHTDYTSPAWTSYKLKLPTSRGNITVPQIAGSLRLTGRDSKIHVVDYDVDGTNILYSTAEVFTWKKFDDSKVLIVYGGFNETHEIAVKSSARVEFIEGGQGVTTRTIDGHVVLNWETAASRTIVKLDDLRIHILNRNDAYKHWVVDLDQTDASVIVRGGYLIRRASLAGSTLSLTADFNATTNIEIIGAPSSAKQLVLNGRKISHDVNSAGSWVHEVRLSSPPLSLPDFRTLQWKAIDALPEIAASFDDSAWPRANKKSNNTMAPQTTPTSLYGSDYGFHAGVLVYRGHFTATGKESTIFLETQGGQAFASSAWINGTFLGSWAGWPSASKQPSQLKLPSALQAGKPYVLTVVVDNNGYKLNPRAGNDEMKIPRGILNYNVTDASSGLVDVDIAWRITGNLGGEDYLDKARGPLNEGGFFVERHGLHLPKPPVDGGKYNFESSTPFDGLSKPGAKLYTAKLTLDLPSKDFDIPITVKFDYNKSGGAFRSLLYVNGWQFGKLAGNLGPQTKFFVPEGILNYKGENQIAVLLWALEDGGAKFDGISLEASKPIWTGRKSVALVESPAWKARQGAY